MSFRQSQANRFLTLELVPDLCRGSVAGGAEAENRYAVGRGVQQDIYRAQLERTMLLETMTSLRQQRRSLEAAMNALLYRPTGTPIGEIPDFPLAQLGESGDRLLELAEANRPALQGLRTAMGKGYAYGGRIR